MSPYRVHVRCKDGSTKILSSMLSQKISSDSIYIVEKYDRDNVKYQTSFLTDNEDEELAYSITTKRNSTILRKYIPCFVWSSKKYKLKYEFNRCNVEVENITCRTLSKCLEAAMQHYCKSQNYSIIKVL